MSDLSIVYFEDDPLSRQVMEMLLVLGLGISDVNIFEDSTDYMSKIERLPQKPSIIFLDIHMKPHNGFTVRQELAASDRYRDVPVIALTASVMNEEVDMLRETGFTGAIGKPIDQRFFKSFIERILQGEEIWHTT